MARIAFSGTAGGGKQGTTATPRPVSSSQEAAYGAGVKRAQYIAAGLFVLLVVLHAKAK
jgi:hypothetical protein